MTPVPVSKTSRALAASSLSRGEDDAAPARTGGSRARATLLRAVSGAAAVPADRRKQSIYFPAGMLQEIEREARRLERPVSWLVQVAWRIARERLALQPGSSEPPAAGEAGGSEIG